MNDWKVHIDDDWRMDAQRLVIYRNVGDRTEIVTGFAHDGATEFTSIEPGVATEFRGLLIPRGALDTIAEHIKPGPSLGEIARLVEALEVERRRVDDTLRFIHGSPP